ncbi:MAG: hypothetical protein GX434_00360 [Peptococcaceae bacterium]|nr:hypothetical protein [Peptococcaceae bacterium]
MVYQDFNHEPVNFGTVDYQEYREGSEAYPMQIIKAEWDISEKNIAFTKSIQNQGAVINLDTRLINDLSKAKNVQRINYNVKERRFEFFGDKEVFYYI